MDALPTPVPLQPQFQAPMRWSTGCCDCFDDCNSCCLTFWCPCITFGRIAEIVDEGSTSCIRAGALYVALWVAGTILTSGAYYAILLATGYTRDFSVVVSGFSWWYSCCYRTKMRHKYFLCGNSCTDCLLHWCCEPCALCQEYREIQSRGFDMSIGWDGNVQKQQSLGATEAPVTQEGMSR